MTAPALTTQPAAAMPPPPAAIRRARGRRPIIIAVSLLIALAGVLTFLVIAFQPFADAVGGCGGG